MTDPLLDIGDSADESTHYLRSVIDMAERSAVVTQDAIYSANGIKLVEKGARIDSRMYDRLVQHKLREPVDMHLTVDNAVTPDTVVQRAKELLASAPLPMLLVKGVGGMEPLLAPLRFLLLTPRIAFKLTVMREQMPVLFIHSLEVMLVAQALALREHLPEFECNLLAAAALLHDLGMLHMDPSWRDPGHKVTGMARRHLIAHPITAMLMVRDAQVYHPKVEEAILEHHERMDGTGYPRAVAGKEISALGQVLLLAEVVAAIYEKDADNAAQQLSLVLRLNHHKFPAPLVAHILSLLNAVGEVGSPPLAATPEQFQMLADRLAQAFAQWEQAKAQCGSAAVASSGPLAFVQERLEALKRALADAGAQPEQHQVLVQQLQGDEEGMAELSFVVREALWQLQNIVNACQRRWPGELEQRTELQVQAVAQWCDWVNSIDKNNA